MKQIVFILDTLLLIITVPIQKLNIQTNEYIYRVAVSFYRPTIHMVIFPEYWSLD